MATILDGKAVSERRLELLRETIDESGLHPRLATVLVGDDSGLGALRPDEAPGVRTGAHRLDQRDPAGGCDNGADRRDRADG